jgi:cytoskeletal protein RodZ
MVKRLLLGLLLVGSIVACNNTPVATQSPSVAAPSTSPSTSPSESASPSGTVEASPSSSDASPSASS